jgi:hypothetical protein
VFHAAAGKIDLDVSVSRGNGDQIRHPGPTGKPCQLHINGALAKTVDRHLANQGHLVGVSFVEVVNLSSMRTLARKGRRRVGYAPYFQRFGLHIPFRTTGCRAYGFVFRHSSDAS